MGRKRSQKGGDFMKWETCFLCGFDYEANLCCFAHNKPINFDTEKDCKTCPYYITTRQARQKILFALGLIKHIDK